MTEPIILANVTSAVSQGLSLLGTLNPTANDTAQVKSLSATLLSTDSFITMIKTDVSSIMSDGAITIIEVPKIISYILSALSSPPKTLNFNISSLSSTALECLIYSIFYFLLLEVGMSTADIGIIVRIFPSLWNLVEYELPEVEAKCFACC